MTPDPNCPRCQGRGYFTPASRSLGHGLRCSCCIQNGKISVDCPTEASKDQEKDGQMRDMAERLADVTWADMQPNTFRGLTFSEMPSVTEAMVEAAAVSFYEGVTEWHWHDASANEKAGYVFRARAALKAAFTVAHPRDERDAVEEAVTAGCEACAKAMDSLATKSVEPNSDGRVLLSCAYERAGAYRNAAAVIRALTSTPSGHVEGE